MNSRAKIIIAKEYLYFWKSIAVSLFLFIITNGVIGIVNNSRNSRILKRQILISNINSLKNQKGSQIFNENAQYALYNFIHEPEYYSKSFAAFKKQFNKDSTRTILYNKMVKMELYSGSYSSFITQYFPAIDTGINNEISRLNNKKLILDSQSLTLLPFFDWKIALLIWVLLFYVLRFLFVSIKKSIAIVRGDKNST